MQKQPDFKQGGFRFDRTITAGNLLVMIGGLIAGMSAYADYRISWERHDARITAVEVAERKSEERQEKQSQLQQDTNLLLQKLSYVISEKKQ